MASPEPATRCGSWGDTPDFRTRARRALAEQYAWYRDHAEELFPIYRDMTIMPPTAQEAMRADNRRLGDLLVADSAPGGPGGEQLRAIARHLLDYRTWRSLAINQELGDAGAVEVGVRLLTVLAAAPKP